MINAIDMIATAWMAETIDICLKSALVLVPAFVALRALPRLSASTRFLIAFYALTATLLVPVLTATLPGWHIVPDWLGSATTQGAPAPIGATVSAPTAAMSPAGIGTTPGTRTELPGTVTSGAGLGLATIVLGVWLCGIGLLALRAAAGVHRLGVIRQQAGALTDDRWQALLHECADAQGVAPAPELRVHPDSIMPVTAGVREPVILLPLEALDWAESRKRDVLMHELAHIRRGDLLTGWIGHLACVMQWFNPLAWLSYRSMIIERERACDDMVLCSGADPSRYADCLLRTATEFHATAAPCPGMARPSDLETRLVSVLDSKRRRGNTGRVVEFAMFVAALAIVVPVSTLAAAERSPVRVDDSQAMSLSETERNDVDRLRGALKSRDAALRAEAREELEQLGRGHPVVVGLSARLFAEHSSDSDVFRKYSSLREGSRSAQSLLDSIKSAFAVERGAAAQALGDYRGEPVVRALTLAVADENWHVREWSARSMGNVGDASGVPALVIALSDTQPAVREWSARALGNIGDEGAVDGLLQSLSDTNADVREWSARALGNIGSVRAVTGLTGSLQDGNDDVREWSARSLGNIGNPQAVDALIAALQDADDDVREWSVRALGDIGDPRAADAIAALGNDRDADVREWSGRVLEGWQ